MKQRNFISLLLCAALLLAAAGCAADPAPTTATTQEPTQATTQEPTAETTTPSYTDPAVTYHAPMSAVSLPTTTQNSQAADGTTLFTYTYQDLSLCLQDAVVADEILVDFLNRLDVSNSAAANLQQSAAAAYTGQDGWEPYGFRVLYRPMRFDEMLLSLYGTESVFDGNSRVTSANLSVSYDLLTGKALGIRDILVADYSAEDLVALIVQGLAEYEKEEMLFPDYRELISDMFFTNRPAENWYFAQDGLCFFFSPYEIAPHSSGTLVSKVPYDALGGLLKDSYFPAEAVTFTGNLVATAFDSAAANQFDRFAELLLSSDGEQVLLYAQGTLLNVQIETGTWSANSKEFTPEAAVFVATAVSKGDAVMIQCEDFSRLRLSYEVQGQRYQMPLLAQ